METIIGDSVGTSIGIHSPIPYAPDSENPLYKALAGLGFGVFRGIFEGRACTGLLCNLPSISDN